MTRTSEASWSSREMCACGTSPVLRVPVLVDDRRKHLLFGNMQMSGQAGGANAPPYIDLEPKWPHVGEPATRTRPRQRQRKTTRVTGFNELESDLETHHSPAVHIGNARPLGDILEICGVAMQKKRSSPMLFEDNIRLTAQFRVLQVPTVLCLTTCVVENVAQKVWRRLVVSKPTVLHIKPCALQR